MVNATSCADEILKTVVAASITCDKHPLKLHAAKKKTGDLNPIFNVIIHVFFPLSLFFSFNLAIIFSLPFLVRSLS